MAGHTPGPWVYVPSNEHHGPYVTSDFGSTICDCYVMSDPTSLSVRNGGTSRPIHHLHEMADPNARLIAAAPEMLEEGRALLRALEDMFSAGHGITGPGSQAAARFGAAIAKAEAR